MNISTPKALGYRFPAEFEPHEATWLSWPHKEASWPGKIDAIFPSYAAFVAALTRFEEVRINVAGVKMEQDASEILSAAGVNMSRVRFFHHPTNDAWCRDHGPAFLVNPVADIPKRIVDWDYNAWGGKYPPHDLDDVIPTRIGHSLGIPVFYPGIIMEGGSIDVNGSGTLITSTCCLLNPNRNPQLSKADIERFLMDFYGQDQILWVDEGIIGDDTDGHIDDTVRFVSRDRVIAAVEEDPREENYPLLQRNLEQLRRMRLQDGKPLDIVELPMPDAVVWDGQRLPASYANFYIANGCVVVPTFRCDAKDKRAMDIIGACFPEREIVGIDSTDIIWGLGSFHCLSQQEPAL